jgi:hypothetical protein
MGLSKRHPAMTIEYPSSYKPLVKGALIENPAK